MKNDLNLRINEVITSLYEGNKARMARNLGIPVTTLRGISEGKEPRAQFFTKLRENLNININWLLTGEGEILIKKDVVVESTPLYKNSSLAKVLEKKTINQIPFYDIKASMGSGRELMEEPSPQYWVIHNNGMLAELGLKQYKANELMAFSGLGDSMYPTIKNGDWCVALKQQTMTVDGVYLIRTIDGLIIKRLQKINNKIWVLSDNTSYEKWKLKEDISIIARVVRIMNISAV